jgi:tetratricopeptide (TPR) repeat protein
VIRLVTALLPLATVLLAGLAAPADGDEVLSVAAARDPELAREPSWRPPDLPDLRRRLDDWLAGERVAEDLDGIRAEVSAIWDRHAAAGPAGDLLDAVIAIVTLVDPRAEGIRRLPNENPAAIEAATTWLGSPATAEVERDAVRLWLGRELVRRDRFEEALRLLESLPVESAVDPAAVLFYRGCCQHWLLEKEAAVESFDTLLEREDTIPLRYARMARLLRADIAAVEPRSLDHIARRMRDVRRRLDLGRAGERTRQVQRSVVESLDALIDELEQQRQQQSGSAAAGGGGGPGGGTGRPMDDSRIVGGRHAGTGEVEKRDIGGGSGWGDLPPHEREAALQQIGREYPAYYREAIEEYFKRLATGEETRP